ncbi:hypothetical protein BC629DRAFT_638138 [Irpex lacteus]|nr:hypothetical protein BC629DRAFT_638138 [Irpex lacteus]
MKDVVRRRSWVCPSVGHRAGRRKGRDRLICISRTQVPRMLGVTFNIQHRRRSARDKVVYTPSNAPVTIRHDEGPLYKSATEFTQTYSRFPVHLPDRECWVCCCASTGSAPTPRDRQCQDSMSQDDLWQDTEISTSHVLIVMRPKLILTPPPVLPNHFLIPGG